jgi:hypothetical protein
MSFPTSPSNGQLYTTSLGYQYQYDSTTTAWLFVATGSTGVQGITGAFGTGYVKLQTFGTTGLQGQTGAMSLVSNPHSVATIGSELIAAAKDRVPTVANDWTYSADWTWAAGGLTHTVQASISANLPNTYDATPVAGNLYQIMFDATTTTAGLIAPAYGNFTSGAITAGVNAPGTYFYRTDGTSFVTHDGFAIGDNVTTSGFTNIGNNNVFLISNVTDATITCSSAVGLVTEAAASGRTFTATSGIAVGQLIGTIQRQAQIVQAVGTGPLTFTPDANWLGSLTNISLKQISPSAVDIQLVNATGSVGTEIRSGGDAAGNLFNTFMGVNAGEGNVSGLANTAYGNSALPVLNSGSENTAIGESCLSSLTTGSDNAAVGTDALSSLTSNSQNVAVGADAGASLVDGSANTFVGFNAVGALMTGNNNVIIGSNAGQNGENEASGTIFTGSNNTIVGSNAAYNDVTGSSQVIIGANAGYYETNSNIFILDNQARSSFSTTKTQAMMYGQFGSNGPSTDGTQYLYINAAVTLPAGSTGAGTAPLTITSGKLTTTPVSGAIENDGSWLYYTTSGNARKILRQGSTGTMNIAFSAGTGNLLYPAQTDLQLSDNVHINNWAVYNGSTGVVNYDVSSAASGSYGTFTNLMSTGIGTFGPGAISASGSTSAWTGVTGLQGSVLRVVLQGSTGTSQSTLALEYNIY